jgi:lipopolysaccharide/colanic/teichoic acid biosynthesis glycosyltransferase
VAGLIKQTDNDVPVRICKILNIVVMAVAFAMVWYGYYAGRALVEYYRLGNLLIIILFAILYFMFCRSYDAFHIWTSTISEIVYSQGLALVITDTVMYMVVWLLSLYTPNPLPMLVTLAVQITLSLLWALSAHKWYFHRCRPRETAVVYDSREGLDGLINEYGLKKRFCIRKVMGVNECLGDTSLLDDCQAVFIAGVHSHERNIILKHCIQQNLDVYVIPRVGDVVMGGAEQVHLFHLPMLFVSRYNPVPEYKAAKRTFDVMVSGLAIIILSPIMVITALAVKSDGGPSLYKQKRLTKDGREFNILKFRSMRVDAEKDGVARLSTGDKDDRVTKVGKVIRAIRFDELPQLFNILKGDMSIVGPRPERPEIATQYEREMPEFGLRLQAKAGLTGYAQVYGKYNTTPYDKLLMDLMYIGNPSFIEDLKICFATVKILFKKDSTEGIAQGQSTALKNRP